MKPLLTVSLVSIPLLVGALSLLFAGAGLALRRHRLYALFSIAGAILIAGRLPSLGLVALIVWSPQFMSHSGLLSWGGTAVTGVSNLSLAAAWVLILIALLGPRDVSHDELDASAHEQW